ncbi:MAG: hypothetical protein AAF389_05460 [Gemmatimonadota bacterium]
MENGTRRGLPLGLPRLLCLCVLAAACEDPLLEESFEPNVTVYEAAEVVTTDAALVVDGAPLIDFGDGIRSIIARHQVTYSYGGLHEPTNDELSDEGWHLDFLRHRVTAERGDSVFLRGVDFGEVALGGSPAGRSERTDPIVTPRDGYVRVIERYLLYRALIYSTRLNRDGSTVEFYHEPYYERMVAGQPVILSAPGSSEVDPATASLTLRPGPRLTGLWNGQSRDYQQSMQSLDVGEHLVIDLDRPLEADRGLVRLLYAPPNDAGVSEEDRRRASATFVLLDDTDRIVIPSSALRSISAHLPEVLGAFIIDVREYLVTPDVMTVRYADDVSETFDMIRTSSVRVYARMPASQ